MENIKLKSLTKENAKDYLEMINEESENSKVRDFAIGLYVTSEKDFNDLLDEYALRNNQFLGIFKEDKLIGALCSQNMYFDNSHEVGFFIRKSERGHHYASQALALFLQKAKELNIKNIMLAIDKRNNASLKVANFVGAKYSHDYEEDEEIHTLEL